MVKLLKIVQVIRNRGDWVEGRQKALDEILRFLQQAVFGAGDQMQKHDMKKIAKGVLLIHRPQFSIVAFLIAIAGISLAGKFDLILMLEVGFLFSFLHCIAHPINDYIDRESDKIGRPDAPIPRKLLTLKQVKIIVGLDYIIGAILILIIPLNLPAKIFATIFLITAYIFSGPPVRATARGIWPSIVMAIAFTSAFVGGWTAVVGWRYEHIFLILSLLIFFTVMTSKIIADIIDVGSDKRSGRNTLPMQIGVKKAIYISAFTELFAMFLFFLAYFVGRMNIFFLIACIIAFILTFLGLFNFQKDYGKVSGEVLRKRYYGIFIFIIVLASIAIILGSI